MVAQPEILLSRNARILQTSRALERAHRRGELTRVAVGAFVETSKWRVADPDEQYRIRVRAAAAISAPSATFSHESAAVLWRLPIIRSWPPHVHEVVGASAGGSSRVGISRHAIGGDASSCLIDHVRVTSLARTIVDVASRSSFVDAVAMADRALATADLAPEGFASRITKDELYATLASRPSARGHSRAQRVFAFANALAESPLESLARVQFRLLGYPDPELQVQFRDERGLIGSTDFYWPELGLVVEADGSAKYGATRQFQRSLTLDELVLKEKQREDRIRRQVRSFARIDWSRAANRDSLAEYLAPHGLVRRHR